MMLLVLVVVFWLAEGGFVSLFFFSVVVSLDVMKYAPGPFGSYLGVMITDEVLAKKLFLPPLEIMLF